MQDVVHFGMKCEIWTIVMEQTSHYDVYVTDLQKYLQ